MKYYKSKQQALDSTTSLQVVDIGSAELKFFRNLRNISGVQEVVLVDVNEETLQVKSYII